MQRRTTLLIVFAILASFMITSLSMAADFTFHGASQFDEKHAFTRLMRKFEQLVKLYYTGDKSIEFVMHLNSELGLEKDYFAYMNQGISVDYAVVAPSHMSTFSKMASLLDPPMLYKNHIHWSKVLGGDALDPIKEDVLKRADVLLIGYGGGGTRHLIVNRPVQTMADVKGLAIRVMGAPIQTRMFKAFGMAPTVIAYAEVYNAIQTGVIDAAENEAAGIQQMKFYEVGPNIALTAHSITVRPLCFSNKTFKRLPKDLQEAILQAGKDAGTYGRVVEATEDLQKLMQMEKEGKLKTIYFKDRDRLVKAAQPVLQAYFAENNASDVLKKIMAAQ
ncbi:MAG: TRAP transporter substrate-binding protein [Deltaproteobacteria bacterium]|nr:TRAP transporter substrate-binding protein [Deltaproteobacteria bacterium]MBW1960906.1 TRAP transporter substrate-binding protein [Deltaproteobacteria bacterium]MBW2152153.1 TRAP transporter substrate-binding protein [Deltaproteobacteria bacterium]